MNERLMERIRHDGIFPHRFELPAVVETHISFVLLGRTYAYKFKKEVVFSFLDFSTLTKRRYYCQREVELNNRMTSGIYLGVVAVRQIGRRITIDGPPEGRIIDYAIRMKRLRRDRQMHVMLEKEQVTKKHILDLADVIRSFHDRAERIHIPFDHAQMVSRFNDIRSIIPFVRKALDPSYGMLILEGIRSSGRFVREHKDLFRQRVEEGFVRDVHGDFHSRNIFLYARPIIFDCIEFKDAFRQLDILDELAFFCMDLEAEGYAALAKAFLIRYFQGVKEFGKKEQELFRYYKAFRANVRAKVSALHAMEPEEPLREEKILEMKKYLLLMQRYVKGL